MEHIARWQEKKNTSSTVHNTMRSSPVAFGIVVGVISSATQSLGLALQRKSHIIAEQDLVLRSIQPPPEHSRPLWRVGFALFLLANIVGSAIQIATLPLVILSPLQGVGLAFNTVCSTLVLKEEFSRWSLYGTILVSVGATFIAYFGSITEPSHTLSQLIALLQRGIFLKWFALSMAFAIGLLLWIYLKKPKGYIKGLAFATTSGILSAHSLLMAKSVAELITTAVVHRDFTFLQHTMTWVIVASFLFFALSQLYFLNCGLKRASTSVLYPLVFCVYNITNIANGLIYFNQISLLTLAQCLCVCLGVAMVLGGVVSLSFNQPPVQLEDQEQLVVPKNAHGSRKSRILSYEQTELLMQMGSSEESS